MGQSTDFIFIPLSGCDVVLGVQWLITLGPILWNFKKLTIQVQWQRVTIIWKGQQPGQVSWMSKKQVTKLGNVTNTGVCAMLLTGVIEEQL